MGIVGAGGKFARASAIDSLTFLLRNEGESIDPSDCIAGDFLEDGTNFTSANKGDLGPLLPLNDRRREFDRLRE
jgi:hypothetical protein